MPGRRLHPRAPHDRAAKHAGPFREWIGKGWTMSVVSRPSSVRPHADEGSSAIDPSRIRRQ